MADRKKTISADSSNPLQTIINLWPYMWPASRIDLKMRVVWATVILLISKFVLLLVPYFFKWSTDALNGKTGHVGHSAGLHDRRRHAGHRLPTGAAAAGRASTSCATRCLPASASMRCASSPTAPSSTCTSCRCAFISSAAPAACRASSSAAPRASRRSSASPSSTPCRPSSNSC